MEGDDPRNGDAAHDSHESKKAKLWQPISDSEIRREFSHHQIGVARINNGSFGCCPGSILSLQTDWQLRFLQQPDGFYFNTLKPGILQSRTLIKALINADSVDDVSLVDNATTAAAIVLHQVGRGFLESKFSPGDAVVMLHCAFQAVKKSIQAYITRAGGTAIEVELPFPVSSNDEIVDTFRKGLKRGRGNGRTVRLAIIDHITSMPSVLLPVKDLVRICREEGAERVFVDAAHAIGCVEIDVKDIGADFIKAESLSDIHHPVVSHEYGNGLPIESAWIGTRDYSSQLVVPSAMEFVNRFEGGIQGIMRRNHEEVVKMGKMLVDSWGTNLGVPPEMCASMVMVGLPSSLCILSEEYASKLRSYLRVNHGVEVPIYYQAIRDGVDGPKDKDGGVITGYVRISHQVYNTIEDYKKLRDAVNQLVETKFSCGMILSE